MIDCYDSIRPDQLPPEAKAAIGYVGGQWPTYTDGSLRRACPHAELIGLCVSPSLTGPGLDVERGDAIPDDIPSWLPKATVHLPVIYCAQSNLAACLQGVERAGKTRADVRFISAHYGQGEHLCAPHSCGAAFEADGTQWYNDNSVPIDRSILVEDFFTRTQAKPTPAPAHPAPASDAPFGYCQTTGGRRRVLGLHNPPLTGTDVHDVQHALAMDGLASSDQVGVYGPDTAHQIDELKLAHNIHEDGCATGCWNLLEQIAHRQ